MSPLTFHLIPHTHWDREWYLTRSGFQARFIPVMDDLLAHLEREPGARFVLDGQTILLEDYLEVRPEAEDRIRDAVGRGALDIGPWYVLADLLIPNGESLLRNLLEGDRAASRFGRKLNVLYSPDAFGHPADLPMVAGEFGIRWAAVRRGLGRPLGLDRDLYWWASHAGGQGCLTYHLPAAGYEIAIHLTYLAAKGDLAALGAEWQRIRQELVARAVSGQIAVFLGADHHPLTPDLGRLRDLLQAIERDHIVRVSGLRRFFESLEAALPGTIPAIHGELRRGDGHTWVLQGVHSARTRLTRRHSEAELTLARLCEPLVALAEYHGGPAQRSLLREAWRALLQSQFHDTLGGSCVDLVADEQAVRLERVETLSRELATRAMWWLIGHDPDQARASSSPPSPQLVLWNPSARRRGGVHTAVLTFPLREVVVGPPGRAAKVGEGYTPFDLISSEGEIVPVQVLARRRDHARRDAFGHHPQQDEVERVFVAFGAPTVGGFGLARLAPIRAGRPSVAPSLQIEPSTMRNDQVRLALDGRTGLQLDDLRTGESYAGLCGLLDEADRGDTYTFSADPDLVPSRPAPNGRTRMLAEGPLIGALEQAYAIPSPTRGDVTARLAVALHGDSPHVRGRLDVDNQASAHRLRLRFPTGTAGTVVAGGPFGALCRSPGPVEAPETPLERNVRTAPAHRFVAVVGADGRRGLAFFAPGFMEYECTSDGTLFITLLRAVGELSRDDLPERPGHAGWPEATPGAQEHGDHLFRFAFVPLASFAESRPDRLQCQWEDLFLPLQAIHVPDATASIPVERLRPVGMDLLGDGLVITAVKPAEVGDGMVLRCYNASDTPTEGRWRFAAPVRGAAIVRADESPHGHPVLSADQRSVGFAAEPHELVTIRIT